MFWRGYFYFRAQPFPPIQWTICQGDGGVDINNKVHGTIKLSKERKKNQDGKYFHIMVQGIGKEYVFPDDDSKGYYLSCLERNIQTNKLDDNILLKLAKEIHERCGTSYRKIAELLEVNRERLRKLIMSTPPSH